MPCHAMYTCDYSSNSYKDDEYDNNTFTMKTVIIRIVGDMITVTMMIIIMVTGTMIIIRIIIMITILILIITKLILIITMMVLMTNRI